MSKQKPNNKDCSEDNKTLCCAKLWKNRICVAFLLILTLEKSEWTLFLMKIQTASVRTWSFVHLILLQIRLQTRHNWTQDFPKIETKWRCCADFIGSNSNVATQVWVTVFITWSLLLCLFLQIVWYVLSYLCVFDLNHSSVHLWRM